MLAVRKSQQVKYLAGIWRIDQVIADAPADAWQNLSCGNGAKGPRVFDWVAAQLPVIDFSNGHEPTHRRWVLAGRSIRRSNEIAYYWPIARPASPWPNGPHRRVPLGGLDGFARPSLLVLQQDFAV